MEMHLPRTHRRLQKYPSIDESLKRDFLKRNETDWVKQFILSERHRTIDSHHTIIEELTLFAQQRLFKYTPKVWASKPKWH